MVHYTVAFATDLAFGNNPASREYEQNMLQSYFLNACQKTISIEAK